MKTKRKRKPFTVRNGRTRFSEGIFKNAVSSLEIERVPISVGVVLSVVLGGYVSWSFQEQYTAQLRIKSKKLTKCYQAVRMAIDFVFTYYIS